MMSNTSHLKQFVIKHYFHHHCGLVTCLPATPRVDSYSHMTELDSTGTRILKLTSFPQQKIISRLLGERKRIPQMIDELVTLYWERAYLKGAYVGSDIGINVENERYPFSLKNNKSSCSMRYDISPMTRGCTQDRSSFTSLTPGRLHTVTHIHCTFPHTRVILPLYIISLFHCSCSPITPT